MAVLTWSHVKSLSDHPKILHLKKSYPDPLGTCCGGAASGKIDESFVNLESLGNVALKAAVWTLECSDAWAAEGRVRRGPE